MEEVAKNRLRLWLRSEKAFGLTDVALPRRSAQAVEESGECTGLAQKPEEQLPEPIFAKVAAPNEIAPRGGLVAPPSRGPFTAPILDGEQKIKRLVALDSNEVRGCTRCRLCEARTNTVFGEGDADAKFFFIGEGPGETEDQTGRPFVGRAGELLTKMIGAMGLKREQVYIANIVKCRPPGNRCPAPDEVATCTPYLERQIEIIRPKVIVTLGLPAARYMLNTNLSMTRLRGQWHEWRGIKLMPTFHPAYVLRQYTADVRAKVWSDLQSVLSELGLPIPKQK